jgi:2-oxoglutarate ferredoxin oxidoreductase subunit delta
MVEDRKPDRGFVEIDGEECKGCGLCVEACVPRVLRLAEYLNRYGYHPAVYDGHGCNGCGLCFFVCPEPGAIRVFKLAAPERGARPEAALAAV